MESCTWDQGCGWEPGVPEPAAWAQALPRRRPAAWPGAVYGSSPGLSPVVTQRGDSSASRAGASWGRTSFVFVKHLFYFLLRLCSSFFLSMVVVSSGSTQRHSDPMSALLSAPRRALTAALCRQQTSGTDPARATETWRVWRTSRYSPRPQPLATTVLLPAPTGLTVFDSLYKCALWHSSLCDRMMPRSVISSSLSRDVADGRIPFFP